MLDILTPLLVAVGLASPELTTADLVKRLETGACVEAAYPGARVTQLALPAADSTSVTERFEFATREAGITYALDARANFNEEVWLSMRYGSPECAGFLEEHSGYFVSMVEFLGSDGKPHLVMITKDNQAIVLGYF